MTAPLRVALLGCGVVGSAVARRLTAQSEDFTARVGRPLQIVGVAVRDTGKQRPQTGLPAEVFTTDADTLVTQADLVVELMGGIEPAKSLLTKAIEHGASVVTANKALLGEHGPELYELADRHGVDFFYEASVAGAIPLLRPLRESLAGDSVRRVMGIVNGTTNFILDKMDRTGAPLEDVLAQAQELGYAEADPTADVEGYDARSKAAILASLAFHSRVAAHDVHCEGIMGVTADDIRGARKSGMVIKLLAICELLDGGVSARVHPAMLPRSHPLATVHEAFNAVFVQTDLAGDLMFYGRGAGGDPTASAVLGDLVQAAGNKVRGGRGPGESAYAALGVVPMGRVRTCYFIRMNVFDRPGALANVANVFAAQGVSIESMRQAVRRADGGLATLHVVTHAAPDDALQRIVQDLGNSQDVAQVASVLRVEGA